jgi:hypothetical protein
MRGEGGRLGIGDLGRDGTTLGGPLLKAAVEDGDVVMTIVGERPPETGGELAARIVVDDDVGIVADPQRAHERSEAVGRSDLDWDGVLEVGYVAGPIYIDSAGYMSLFVLVERGQILGLLALVPEVPFLYVAANVYDARARVFKVLGEPVCANEGVVVVRHLLFLLEEVVLAGVGFG